MTRDGLTRMDVDANIMYHRKVRKLQSAFPRTWTHLLIAWLALLGEAWKSGHRDVSMSESWVPANSDLEAADAVRSLKSVGLLDVKGRVPEDTWDEWYGPAAMRLHNARNAAAVRWGNPPAVRPQSEGIAPAMPIANQPTNQPTKTRRVVSTDKTSHQSPPRGSDDGMASLKESMEKAGLLPAAGRDPLTSD